MSTASPSPRCPDRRGPCRCLPALAAAGLIGDPATVANLHQPALSALLAALVNPRGWADPVLLCLIVLCAGLMLIAAGVRGLRRQQDALS